LLEHDGEQDQTVAQGSRDRNGIESGELIRDEVVPRDASALSEILWVGSGVNRLHRYGEAYRSQGRTVDSVFALASSAEARRGLCVDVTRAREDVKIAYGKDEVQDFGDLLVRAQRDNGKVLVRDVNLRIERQEERKRLPNVALEQGQKPKIDLGQEPKIDRSRGRGIGR